MAVVAVLSCVAMSKVTSVEGEGADRLTVKVAVTVPLLPSVTCASFIERLGGVPVVQLFRVELVLRGLGVETIKSAALSFVSVQPPFFLKSAIVLLLVW